MVLKVLIAAGMIYVIREAEMCSALVTENNLCRGTIYLCTYTKLQKVQ